MKTGHFCLWFVRHKISSIFKNTIMVLIWQLCKTWFLICKSAGCNLTFHIKNKSMCKTICMKCDRFVKAKFYSWDQKLRYYKPWIVFQDYFWHIIGLILKCLKVKQSQIYPYRFGKRQNGKWEVMITGGKTLKTKISMYL